MIIHLLIGSRTACLDEIPRGSPAALDPALVTCKRCQKTKIFRKVMAAKKPPRRNGMKQEELF